jgi:hypothetical protein
MQRFGPINIPLLPALRTAAEEHDQCLAISGQVDSVARSQVNHVFADAGKPLDAGGVAQLHTQVGSHNFRGRPGIEIIEPDAVRARAVSSNVLFGLDRPDKLVTYMLPIIKPQCGQA